MIFSSLERWQKEAVILLQAGTFLEYFDLMLYVHMVVLLNEIFFPKTDPHTTALLSALAFCSTFIMRPLGALVFGYIGDHAGRKVTVIYTTILMASSCIMMANLPTYAQVGIAAAWFVTLCRVAQGISSMGEIIGAEIYLTEIIKPPLQYVAVGLTSFSSALGGVVALLACSAVSLYGFNWRLVFWIGGGIALIGTAARTRLRETQDFADMKRRIKRDAEEAEDRGFTKTAAMLKKATFIKREKINNKTLLYYFLLECAYPVCFYFAYIHCGNILKSLGYTPEQVIQQNFAVSIVQAVAFLLFILAGYKIHPLKILKFRIPIFILLSITYPFILTHFATPLTILFVQSSCICFSLTNIPAQSIFFIHFPVFKRFTTASFVYALSRAMAYLITSFTLVYLVEIFDQWGLLLIMIPATIGYALGVNHFSKLEKLRNSGPELPKKPFVLDGDENLEVSAALR